MKHNGCVVECLEKRAEELEQTYYDLLADSEYISKSQIYSLVAESTCSRFWVSSERAAVVIARMSDGYPMPSMRRKKKEMYDEIYQRYVVLRGQHPHKTIPELIEMIIHQPAPSFYMEPRSIAQVLKRMNKC